MPMSEGIFKACDPSLCYSVWKRSEAVTWSVCSVTDMSISFFKINLLKIHLFKNTFEKSGQVLPSNVVWVPRPPHVLHFSGLFFGRLGVQGLRSVAMECSLPSPFRIHTSSCHSLRQVGQGKLTRSQAHQLPGEQPAGLNSASSDRWFSHGKNHGQAVLLRAWGLRLVYGASFVKHRHLEKCVKCFCFVWELLWKTIHKYVHT